MKWKKLKFDPGDQEHIHQTLSGLGQAGQNAHGNNQGNAVANAAIGDLFAQPHEQHRAGGQDDCRLKPVPPEVVNQHELAVKIRENGAGMLPANSHDHALRQAKKQSQDASVLDELAAPAFLARQLAQEGNHRLQQLQDDRRADVRHDAQGAHRAFFEAAAGEHAVHPHQTIGACRACR